MVERTPNWSDVARWAALAVVLLVDGAVLLAAVADAVVAVVTDMGRLTAFATAFGAVGTFVAVVVAARQLIEQRVISRFSSSRDSLWHFDTEWERNALARQRLQAACESGTFHGANPQDDEDAMEVLNFFDGLAFMANRDQIDDEITWSWYYDQARYTWDHLSAHILYWQGVDPLLWCEFKPWLDRITLIEQRRRGEAEAAKAAAATEAG
jgi:hypothetical protein